VVDGFRHIVGEPLTRQASPSGETAPIVSMAPLKGITDYLFRRVYTSHFSGIDRAIAPFINPQRKGPYPDKLIADVLPENNSSLTLIPQIINTEPEGFIELANRLYDIGYTEINWNLGCPVRMVASKRRGAGMLPYPEEIAALLDTAIPQMKPALSIKMRLGYQEVHESQTLLPMLNDYPLSEIIIHPRLGIQLYRGTPDLDQFQACSARTAHRLVYNGDIINLSGFSELQQRCAPVHRWMIGRGLLSNPFLPAEIKGIRFSSDERSEKLQLFHDDLYHGLKERLSGPGHLLGRMKQVWIYYIHAFPGKEKLLKKITRAPSEKSYLKAVDAVLER
jgi:tRNA-dihydrouridine synthase B